VLHRYPAHDVVVQDIGFVNNDGRRVVDGEIVVSSAVSKDGSVIQAKEDKPSRDKDADVETQIAEC